MIFSLFSLMFIVVAGLALMMLVLVLSLTVKLGVVLAHGVSSLLPVALILVLALLAARSLRTPPHGSIATLGWSASSPLPHPPGIHHPPLTPPPPTPPQAEMIAMEVGDSSPRMPPDVPAAGPALNQPPSSAGDEAPLAIDEIHRDAQGQVEQERQLTEIPGWVRVPPLAHAPGNPRVIVHSQRFATLEEARNQLNRQVRQQVQSRFNVRAPKFRRWPLTMPDLASSGLVRKECVVTWPLQVGEFQEPVVQLYWELQFSPEVERRLMAAARTDIVQMRLAGLAGAFGTATLVLAAGAYLALRHGAR